MLRRWLFLASGHIELFCQLPDPATNDTTRSVAAARSAPRSAAACSFCMV